MSESLLTGTSGQASGTAAPAAGNPAPAGSGAAGSASASAGASGGVASWRDSLPEDIKSNTALTQFQDVGALAKSYVHAQTLIGKKGVVVPGEKASDEEWGSFYKAIGLPEADKYTVNPPKDVQVNEQVMTKFKETAYKAGLLPKQAQGILDWYTKFEQETVAAQVAQKQADEANAINQLKNEWGDGFTKQVGLAQMAVREADPDGSFQKYLVESGLGNNTKLTKFLAGIGKMLGEDKLRGQDSSQFGQTPDELQSELQGFFENPAFSDKHHPEHAKLVRQYADVNRKLFGA